MCTQFNRTTHLENDNKEAAEVVKHFGEKVPREADVRRKVLDIETERRECLCCQLRLWREKGKHLVRT